MLLRAPYRGCEPLARLFELLGVNVLSFARRVSLLLARLRQQTLDEGGTGHRIQILPDARRQVPCQ